MSDEVEPVTMHDYYKSEYNRLKIERETVDAKVEFWKHQYEYVRDMCVDLAHRLEYQEKENR